MMRPRQLLLWLGWALLVLALRADDAVWQWSVPVEHGRAYLWVPERAQRVRAVVLAQHNMLERGILQHATMRRTLADLGIAEVFIVPSMDPVYRFDAGARERYQSVLQELAEASGYAEIATAPVVPIGHSAHASFPWNFAAGNPERTLAVLSIKGDAPLTDLTGSGRPNPDWGDRGLDGVPGLMVMGEYEWWEARLAPLLAYREGHPAAPLSFYADVGHGHFDATDSLGDFLALFVRKAAAARLPQDVGGTLRAVESTKGWLVDRWSGDEPLRAEAAPWADYQGPRAEAVWCFDAEMAQTIEARYATSRGKRPQQLAFRQDGAWVPISNAHAGVELVFQPEADGVTFRLEAGFVEPLPPNPPVATKDKRPPVVVVTPRTAEPGNFAAGDVAVLPVIGPVVEVSPGVFRMAPDRMFDWQDPKSYEAWFVASHPGNMMFKGTVRQAVLRLPRYVEGAEQTITFPVLNDRSATSGAMPLRATSSAGPSVVYFVREGPAYVDDGVLHLTPVPPRAKWPVKVTVVAWQMGREAEPKISAAAPVERSFWLSAP